MQWIWTLGLCGVHKWWLCWSPLGLDIYAYGSTCLPRVGEGWYPCSWSRLWGNDSHIHHLWSRASVGGLSVKSWKGACKTFQQLEPMPLPYCGTTLLWDHKKQKACLFCSWEFQVFVVHRLQWGVLLHVALLPLFVLWCTVPRLSCVRYVQVSGTAETSSQNGQEPISLIPYMLSQWPQCVRCGSKL